MQDGCRVCWQDDGRLFVIIAGAFFGVRFFSRLLRMFVQFSTYILTIGVVVSAVYMAWGPERMTFAAVKQDYGQYLSKDWLMAQGDANLPTYTGLFGFGGPCPLHRGPNCDPSTFAATVSTPRSHPPPLEKEAKPEPHSPSDMLPGKDREPREGEPCTKMIDGTEQRGSYRLKKGDGYYFLECDTEAEEIYFSPSDDLQPL